MRRGYKRVVEYKTANHCIYFNEYKGVTMSVTGVWLRFSAKLTADVGVSSKSLHKNNKEDLDQAERDIVAVITDFGLLGKVSLDDIKRNYGVLHDELQLHGETQERTS